MEIAARENSCYCKITRIVWKLQPSGVIRKIGGIFGPNVGTIINPCVTREISVKSYKLGSSRNYKYASTHIHLDFFFSMKDTDQTRYTSTFLVSVPLS